ncbi:MAG: DUF3515 family protein [Marmoricola sp.]
MARAHAPRPLPGRTALSVAALTLLAGTLAGCGGNTVSIVSFPVDAGARTTCRALLADLPHRVAGQKRRPVDGSSYAAAWGDPPIVLRCGPQVVPGKPESDPCETRNGIGWTVPPAEIDDLGSRIDMSLSHRGVHLTVRIPARYRPNGPSEVMADLDQAIRAHTRAHGHCS